jgi:hypothetical protein
MQDEIEARFLYIDHHDIQRKLGNIGAKCKQSIRLMCRTILDYLYHRLNKEHVCIRKRDRDNGRFL